MTTEGKICKHKIFMRRVLLLTSFFVITPIVFALNVILLAYFSYLKTQPSFSLTHQTSNSSVVYAALPTIQNISDIEITQEDARIEMIRQFFARYKSPLEPYAKDIIFYADLYNLDFRIVPAIAMQESNLCLKAPEDSNNCWGYGIYGGKVRKFDSYTDGIGEVTKTLATVYRKNGLDTPEEIMSRYTPSSNGSWANGVSYFINQLQ